MPEEDDEQAAVFSISCYECDAGLGMSRDEVIAEGWTEIMYFPEGVAESFLGLCPVCRLKEES